MNKRQGFQNIFLSLLFISLACVWVAPTVLAWETVNSSTPIRAQYINELRAAVDAKRALLGLGPYAWTAPHPAVANTVARAVYFSEIRDAISELATYSYNDPPMTSGSLYPGAVLRSSNLLALQQALDPYSAGNGSAISFCGDLRCDSDLVTTICGGIACEACTGAGNPRECSDCGVCPCTPTGLTNLNGGAAKCGENCPSGACNALSICQYRDFIPAGCMATVYQCSSIAECNPSDGNCTAPFEDLSNDPAECSVCGDGQCTGPENGTNCSADCTSCGDGIANGTEQCDGSDLNGAICSSVGTYAGGTLSCDSSCNFVTTACTYGCVVNGLCDSDETQYSCPVDCGGNCTTGAPNSSCETGEDFSTCPDDCHCSNSSMDYDETGTDCGGSVCGACPSSCGDGICDPLSGEQIESCVMDCVCGDGVCDKSPPETFAACPADCAATCKNGTCDPGETAITCPSDCQGCNNNGLCQGNEDCASCPSDCAYIPPSAWADQGCGVAPCPFYERLETRTDVCGGINSQCVADAACVCADNGTCEPGLGENSTNCGFDCYCGDTICGSDENNTNCPADCNSCGDGTCDAAGGENSSNCAADCWGCGDGYCDAAGGENSSNCSPDCGTSCLNIGLVDVSSEHTCTGSECSWPDTNVGDIATVPCSSFGLAGQARRECQPDGTFGALIEECYNCGNGTCNSPSETNGNCPADCP